MWKRNQIWNILTILAYALVAIEVKYPVLALSVVVVALVSTSHHLLLQWSDKTSINMATFTLDCMAQLSLLFTFTYLCKPNLFLHPKLKSILLCFILVSAIGILAYSYEVQSYCWGTTALCAWIVSILYFIILLSLLKQFGIITILTLFLVCCLFLVGNMMPSMYKVAWPLLHIIGLLATYCVFKDLGMTRSHN